jgi:hypothetical protein
MYLLCTDVGPVHPTKFSRTRQHPRPEAGPITIAGPTTVAGGPLAGEDDRILRRVEQNLTALTRTVPMAEIEDLPPSMQPHVVGVPRTWVQLFRRLENAVVHIYVYLHIFISYGLHLFTNVFSCVCVCFFLHVCKMPI